VPVTAHAEQGIELMQSGPSRASIPIHYNDYDVFKSPLSDLQPRVRAAGVEERVHYLVEGETFHLPASVAER